MLWICNTFSVCLLYFSKTVHWSTHKDDFSCCPEAGRTWEAAGTGELGCALLWVFLSLAVIWVIEQHMHILPGDTQVGSTPGPVMEKGSWWEPFECLHILCIVPEAAREQKVQHSLSGGKESYPGLLQVAKQTCTDEAEKQALLTGWHQQINVESSASLGISTDFASEK